MNPSAKTGQGKRRRGYAWTLVGGTVFVVAAACLMLLDLSALRADVDVDSGAAPDLADVVVRSPNRHPHGKTTRLCRRIEIQKLLRGSQPSGPTATIGPDDDVFDDRLRWERVSARNIDALPTGEHSAEILAGYPRRHGARDPGAPSDKNIAAVGRGDINDHKGIRSLDLPEVDPSSHPPTGPGVPLAE